MDNPSETDAVVSVTVPARPDLIQVLRSVTAGVAARLDLPYDDIDDLRIAVDEACAQLLRLAGRGSQLTLRLESRLDGLELAATIRSDGLWPPPVLEDSMAWRVLSALLDEARFERDGEEAVVRMLKRLPADGERS